MQKPTRDPHVDDIAPSGALLTRYDEGHLVTYWRMLDANKEGADWREVSYRSRTRASALLGAPSTAIWGARSG